MNTAIKNLTWGILLVVLLMVGLWLGGCLSPAQRPYGKFEPKEIGPCNVLTLTVDGQPTTIMELMTDRLTYTAADGTEWTAVKGTLTDGASIPSFALSFTGDKFSASFLKAAIVHDAYCQCFIKDQCPEQYHKRPWREVHQMFRDACIAGGTDVRSANLLFAAVWICGPRWGDDSRSLCGVASDYQRMLFNDCKDFIEKPTETGAGKDIEKNQRSTAEIETWMEKRQPTILAIDDLETQAMNSMEAGDLSGAVESLAAAEKTLNEATAKLPNDLMVQNLWGYHHKNLAYVYQRAEIPQQKHAELEKAEAAFQKVISVRPRDASALNGMGSVLILRGEFDAAKTFVDKALDIDPTYPAAKHDRALLDKIEQDRAPNSAPPR